MLTLCIGFALALLDQWTKWVVMGRFALGGSRDVIPGFFDLRYIQNTGAAWGIFQGLSHWLVVLSVAMLACIVIFRRHFMRDRIGYKLAMGLMVGGIWGNLIDRVRLGYVVDFLHFFHGSYHFPAFNVADSGICVGVGLYILLQLLEARAAGQPAAGADSR